MLLTISAPNLLESSNGEAPHLAKDQGNAPQLVLWDNSLPNVQCSPLHGLVSITCACFAPENIFVVAAGSSTGVIALWDLREHGDLDTQARYAVFTTDGACKTPSLPYRAHTSAIIDVRSIPDVTSSRHGTVSFQLASVDDRGLIATWLVVELSFGVRTSSLVQTIAGLKSCIDETHLGLRAGGLLRQMT